MRIAVSGTHGSGKSTLIEDFIAVHNDYIHEPEPYEWMKEIYGEMIAEEPTADDFYRQLEVSVDRLGRYGRSTTMIAERSPLDFLAYLLALTDLGRSGRDCELTATAAELVAAGIANLDLLVVLPLDDRDGIVVPASEDPELRDAMNERLLDLMTGDPYSLFGSGQPRTIEIHGNRQDRLRMLEEAIAR
ncbi:MAG TPA: hypothetical protein VN181_12855 [Thermoanaerobaculia bacterium]|nr:hypothetical protein [Thermoanaerobaculia bacterium]